MLNKAYRVDFAPDTVLQSLAFSTVDNAVSQWKRPDIFIAA
jgi:hypothetical protein